ncbi:MAG: bifunctional phosphoglucose/phosphomannose isomerase [Patescibacteria group bacterium]|nr:bifunctional phosphoglucose/phosphomannose isomerase [Patescibacteria group bacterium]
MIKSARIGILQDANMTGLTNLEEIKKIDKSNLRQVIIDFPDQFKEGLEIAKHVKLEGRFDNVTISGMGGSALPANLLRIYCNSLLKKYSNFKHFEITINRYYSLPPESYSSNHVNFIASYSGNTEETISSLEELHGKNIPFIGLSSGGKIQELCKKYKMPFVKLPVPNVSFQPRMGTGFFFGAIIQVFINQKLIPDVSEELIKDAEKLKLDMKNKENQGKKIASMIKGKTPVIYASPKYKSVAMVWKIKINENSKTPAFWNFLPESNHNEMVGFTNPQGKFIIIMLKDSDDNPRNLKRYEATSRIMSDNGIENYIIEMNGESVFEKIFESISLADWTSYYLAMQYNQDPTPVDLVEKLKKILAS